ncbi:hypothetical protein CENSYa_0822 [Cenarchaeum symbiosum A]|uniref:Uncharacterized protein n=1 Tax=Cenarchaeum symbiosum (strain A) TaxID=414004 RepID=A0RVT8_CENSY|nr:hypothetical protein CENSYa_0822 [Cenarchaeum symbiosum A]
MVEQSEESLIRSLSPGELRDLGALVESARHILYRHEENRKLHTLMGELVSMMDESAGSVERLEGTMDEMALSAADSIRRIREAQARLGAVLDIRKASPGAKA